MAKAKASKKASKKRATKAKKGKTKIPKALRKGALPTSVGEVMAAGLGALREAQSSGGKQFDALLTRGRVVQASGSTAAREAAREVEEAVDRVMQTVRSAGDTVVEGVQDRLESVVEGAVAGLGVPRRSEIVKLRATVDALAATLAKASDASSTVPTRNAFSVLKEAAGWAVRRAGENEPVGVHSTKKQALHEGRALARNDTPSVLVVFKLDGTPSDTTSYGA